MKEFDGGIDVGALDTDREATKAFTTGLIVVGDVADRIGKGRAIGRPPFLGDRIADAQELDGDAFGESS